jgi:hypothetical protein
MDQVVLIIVQPMKCGPVDHVEFGVSLSRPLYDLRKKVVRKLRGVAWHIHRVHIFKTVLPDLPPMSAENEKEVTLAEFMQTVPSEELADTSEIEAQQADWLALINTNIKLQSAVLMHLEWYKTGNLKELKKSVKASKLYEEKLPRWGAHKLACLCVIIACDQFELANPDMSKLDAEQVWNRALDIFQQIRSKASRPRTDRRDLSRAKRSKVFRDLGIKLTFPNGLKKVNASANRASQTTALSPSL